MFDKLKVTYDRKGKKINGAEFKGKKILILKNGRIEYSSDKRNVKYVNEFKILLEKAKKEYQKTLAALVEERTGVSLPPNIAKTLVIN